MMVGMRVNDRWRWRSVMVWRRQGFRWWWRFVIIGWW